MVPTPRFCLWRWVVVGSCTSSGRLSDNIATTVLECHVLENHAGACCDDTDPSIARDCVADYAATWTNVQGDTRAVYNNFALPYRVSEATETKDAIAIE